MYILKRIAVTLVCFSSVYAAAAPFGLQFQIGQYSIDSKTAKEEGIEESGLALGADLYTVLADHLRVGGGFFSLFMGDNEQYDMMVEDQNGNVFEAESSAAVGAFYGEIGLTAQPLPKLRTDLTYGYGLGVSNRQISNCMDCGAEKLDVSVGSFIKPRISYIFRQNQGSHIAAGLEYTHFLADSDMESGLMLSLSMELKL